MAHGRKIELRAFLIGCLKSIARDLKATHVMRMRAIDRIAIMEKYYPVALLDAPTVNAGREMQDPATNELDSKVQKLLDQINGGDDAKLSTSVAG